ncbi:MAG TPA: CsbD family protein [Steroidobacteraceae bacterium]|nr:CsbD family protein [Steroidobacteraceae bacterium]
MNWERFKANWTQLRGHVRVQWGRLTDDQLDVIEGRRDLLLGKLQEAYGVTAEEAERQVSAWENAALGDATASAAVAETTPARGA